MKDLLAPWVPTTSEQEQHLLEEELSRELGPGHVLAGKTVRALARRCDRDDILVETEAGLAVVHLSWSGKQEPAAEWPKTELFSSLDEWKAKGMNRDHEDYMVGT